MARALIFFLLALVACTKATPPAPVPKDDEPKIRAILDADARRDRALREAEHQADDAHIADMIEGKAIPATDDAIAVANAQAPVTAWGKEQKEALLALLYDWRQTLPHYAKAVRGEDIEAKLAAVEKQRELQERTIEVVSRALQTPP